MEVDSVYKIINLYKTREYDKCLKICDTVLQQKSDRMIEFIRMRAMTIQAKISGNGYEEVNYFAPEDDLASTMVAKTPRQGTSFQRPISAITVSSALGYEKILILFVASSYNFAYA